MRGTSDERWLWPEAIRVMREFRPAYAVFENPPALITLEHGDAWNGILSGLVALGYDLWWDVFPAAAFGAGHLRERVILVARVFTNDNGEGLQGYPVNEASDTGRQARPWSSASSEDIRITSPNANNGGLEYFTRLETWTTSRPATPDLRGRVSCPNWWHEAHTGIPVLASGIPGRVVEAVSRCIGNSVVPQAIVPVMEAIANTEKSP